MHIEEILNLGTISLQIDYDTLGKTNLIFLTLQSYAKWHLAKGPDYADKWSFGFETFKLLHIRWDFKKINKIEPHNMDDWKNIQYKIMFQPSQ